MPALPGLPLNVPPKLSLPGDLPALASGALPGAAAHLRRLHLLRLHPRRRRVGTVAAVRPALSSPLDG